MNEGVLAVLVSGVFGLAGIVINTIWAPRLAARIAQRSDVEAAAGAENSRLRRGIGMHIPICDEPGDLVALLKPPTS